MNLFKLSSQLRLVFSVLLCFVSIQAFSQDAASILKKSAEAYEASNGVKINFTLRAYSEESKSGESFDGVIDMKNEKFKSQTPDMITWYDGKTQWTYMDRTEEVNVTEPDGAELQFTNPIVFINSYEKGFKASLKGTSTTRQGKSAYDIELTPKKKGDITKVTIQIEKNTGNLASIDIEAKNGLRNTIVISKWQTNMNQPDNFFVFNEEDYPDAEVVDLR
ncbi:MAG: LolA-like putative outer membrane lipoprotein chaperone [Parabacteroides sp.]|nr:LolA-like putative outer membrane lipoprotein chaperone [Parabacteroides sp.]